MGAAAMAFTGSGAGADFVVAALDFLADVLVPAPVFFGVKGFLNANLYSVIKGLLAAEALWGFTVCLAGIQSKCPLGK
jgi:hypothetical protein